MHRKRIFTLAAVFLVIALVVPPAIIVLQTLATNPVYRYLVPGLTPVEGTTNVTIVLTHAQREMYDTAFIVAASLEIIFIALFVITMYYGINHTHPEH